MRYILNHKFMKRNLFLLLLSIPFLALTEIRFANPISQNKVIKANNNIAYTYGEQLEYRVHYGPLNAATIKMWVEKEPKIIDGVATWQIVGEGNTHSGYDWFFKVRDRYESYIEQDSLKPIKYIRKVQEGGYKDYEVAKFDHSKGKIYSSKGIVETKDHAFQDVLSSIYYLRNIDFSKMKKGEKIYINFYLDKILYSSMITFAGRETITTDIGTFNSIVLKPKVLVDRVFPNEDAMTIWASDDLNLIPLRIKTELMVGSLKADITKIIGNKNPMTAKLKKR